MNMRKSRKNSLVDEVAQAQIQKKNSLGFNLGARFSMSSILNEKPLFKYVLKYDAIYEVQEIEDSFLLFLKTEMNSDPLEFVRECKKFKEITKEVDKVVTLRRILNDYIFPNGPKELNISGKARNNILFKLKESGQLDQVNWIDKTRWVMDDSLDELFSETLRFIKKDLEIDSYGRYIESPLWKSIQKDYQNNEAVCEKLKIFDMDEENDDKKWKRTNEEQDKKEDKKMFKTIKKEAKKESEDITKRSSLGFIQKISDLGSSMFKESPRKKTRKYSSLQVIDKKEKIQVQSPAPASEKKSQLFKNIKGLFGKKKVEKNEEPVVEKLDSDDDSDLEDEYQIEPVESLRVFVSKKLPESPITSDPLIKKNEKIEKRFGELETEDNGEDEQFKENRLNVFKKMADTKKREEERNKMVEEVKLAEYKRKEEEEKAMVAESKRKQEEERLSELRKQEELRTEEERKKIQQKREEEDKERFEELKKQEEVAKLAQEKRREEELLLLDLQRKQKEEEEKIQELRRLQEEARILTQQKKMDEEKRLEEDKRVSDEKKKQEEERILQEIKLANQRRIEQEEKIHLAEEERKKEEEKLQHLRKLLKEEEDKIRLAEEKRKKDEQVALELKRKQEEERLVEEKRKQEDSQNQLLKSKLEEEKLNLLSQKLKEEEEKFEKLKKLQKELFEAEQERSRELSKQKVEMDRKAEEKRKKEEEAKIQHDREERMKEEKRILDLLNKLKEEEEKVKIAEIKRREEEAFFNEMKLKREKELKEEEERIKQIRIEEEERKRISKEQRIKDLQRKQEEDRISQLKRKEEEDRINELLKKQEEMKIAEQERIQRLKEKEEEERIHVERLKKIKDEQLAEETRLLAEQKKKEQEIIKQEEELKKKLQEERKIEKAKLDMLRQVEEKEKERIEKKLQELRQLEIEKYNQFKKENPQIIPQSGTPEEKVEKHSSPKPEKITSPKLEKVTSPKPEVSEIKKIPLGGKYSIKEEISSEDEIEGEDDEETPIIPDPGLAAKYLSEGIQLAKSKQWEEAVDKFTLAIDHDETLKEAYFNRGILNYNREKHLNCVMDMYKVISLDPNMIKAYNVRGMALKKLEKWDLAIADFKKSLENEIVYNNYMLLGICYDQVNKLDEAIECYTNFIEKVKELDDISPINQKNLIFVFCNRALDYCQKLDFKRSLKDYTKAIKLCDDEDQIRDIKGMRAKCHKIFGNEQEAKEDLKDSLSDIDHYNNGIEAVQLKQYKEAHEHFSNAIEQNSDNWNYFYGRSICLKNLDKLEDSILDLKCVLQLDPENLKALQILSKLYVSMDKYSKALKIYGKLIELEPTPQYYFARANLYCEIEGKEQEALEDYKNAIELEPTMFKAYFNRGLLYFQCKNYKKAIKDFNETISLNPSDANAYVDRGLSYFYLKNKTEAIEDFKKAKKLDPKNERAKNILKDLNQE
jgi:Flp pilus assembly protein TadD